MDRFEKALGDLCMGLTRADAIISLSEKVITPAFLGDWKELWNKANKAVPVLQEALTLTQKPTAPDAGWLPIDTMPDARNVLVCEKIAGSDFYFEPEIIYKNGDFYFRSDGGRSSGVFMKEAKWMHIPSKPMPPITKKPVSGEQG